MKRINQILTALFLVILFANQNNAQDKLYGNEFALRDVKLHDGPLKDARDLNIKILLTYDVDRLLAPYRKEAGLPEKAKGFPNWEGLDGHIGGHYLSAMAINYAATGNVECKKRMEYMIAELKACQEANNINNPGWGTGYVGGVPNSDDLWPKIKEGNVGVIWNYWVPWYNVHKMYSGLRDAWLYADSQDAKTMFLKFCDWAISITAPFSEEQMQSMLNSEHGGMNEIFADAYQITGDEKYLVAAKRFSHRMLLDAMASGIDNLDNKHANTQVPKAVGFQRIAEVSKNNRYAKAGSFFWETVTENRTLAFGGNSRREFFPAVTSCTDFINDVEGPESCNTYNMLKLTEGLFRTDPQVKYVDYYERAIYNHILSTQHPAHGGYVYFTPVRPRHYRVYSAPNEAMWCCVGSGMENHGKYNQFIYTHNNESLFLNLFVASELNWKDKGLTIVQETEFPRQETTKLKIAKGSARFKLLVRYPSWVKAGELRIMVNEKVVDHNTAPGSYVAIDRKWKAGDEVQITLPMHTSIEHMPNVPEYIAFMHGPIMLGAKTGTENLSGLVANDSRWGHIAHGERLPIDKAPVIIDDNISDLGDKITPVKGKPLSFSLSGLKMINPMNLKLEPFYQIHDARYMVYWMALSNSQYKNHLDSLARMEKEKLALEKRTIDFVAPGEQQPEADHALEKENSHTGVNLHQFWRDARNEGYFSYKLSTKGETELSLIVRYWGAEWGNRKFDIYIDDEKFLTVDNTGKWNQSRFREEEYKIPASMVSGKDNIRVKFQAIPGNTAGAIYYVRLVRTQKNETN